MSFYKHLEKEELQYFIVKCISKNTNTIKWFMENFPKTITSTLILDGIYYKQAFKVNNMSTWGQTKDYIYKAKAAFNGLMVTITPMYKTVSK